MLVSVAGAREPPQGEAAGPGGGPVALAPERVRWAADEAPDDARADADLGRLEELAAVRADPERLAMNWSLCETVDEIENELAAAADVVAAQLGARTVVVCEGSPPERNRDRDALAQAAARLETRGGLTVVLGSGWARPAARANSSSSTSSSSSSAEERIVQLRDRFVGDLEGSPTQSPPCGFIGELDIETENDIDEVISAAARAQRTVSRREGAGRPPIVVQVSGLARALARDCEKPEARHVGSPVVFEALLQRCIYMWSVFEREAGLLLEGGPNDLIFAGLVDALPHAYFGLEVFGNALTSLAQTLLAATHVGVAVGANSPMGPHMTAAALVKLAELGFTDRICLTSGVRFKSDLRRWGGDGYARGALSLCQLLDRAGFSTEDLSAILGRNLVRALAWYTPPAPEAPKPRPRWACDGPCGKTYSAKREPFIRLEFRYCSMDCLRAHQRELEAGKPAPDDSNRRGGGGRRGAGNVGKWGVAVGT